MKGKAINAALWFSGLILSLAVSQAGEIEFHSRHLEKEYHGEGAAFGDFNGDAHSDLVSGPFWYEGPEFQARHEFYPPAPKDPNKNGYTNDNFLVFVNDINRDGWSDILIVAFPGTAAHWFENPRGKEGHWQKHLVLNGVGNESPFLFDLDGDQVDELFCVSNGAFGYAQSKPKSPQSPWTFHPISAPLKLGPYVHGLGIGDIDGDEREDLLTKDGWFKQPSTLTSNTPWTFHRYDLRPSRRLPFPGGAQIFAYDVDGDNDKDLIMSLAAHGYGLAWFEQDTENGARIFKQHTLLREDGKPTDGRTPFSQLHALALADVDGDGLKDIITGKCRFAHGPEGDPEPKADPVLYWFRLDRSDTGTTFSQHLISQNAGVGRQIAIGKANTNEHIDIAIGNKSGTTLLTR